MSELQDALRLRNMLVDVAKDLENLDMRLNILSVVSHSRVEKFVRVK